VTLCALVYRCLHGDAPSYLSWPHHSNRRGKFQNWAQIGRVPDRRHATYSLIIGASRLFWLLRLINTLIYLLTCLRCCCCICLAQALVGTSSYCLPTASRNFFFVCCCFFSLFTTLFPPSDINRNIGRKLWFLSRDAVHSIVACLSVRAGECPRRNVLQSLQQYHFLKLPLIT